MLRRSSAHDVSDPFCVVSVPVAPGKPGKTPTLTAKFTTKTIKNQLNPVWNEEHVFHLNWLDSTKLDGDIRFSVWDAESGPLKHQFLGLAVVPLPGPAPESWEGRMSLHPDLSVDAKRTAAQGTV